MNMISTYDNGDTKSPKFGLRAIVVVQVRLLDINISYMTHFLKLLFHYTLDVLQFFVLCIYLCTLQTCSDSSICIAQNDQ